MNERKRIYGLIAAVVEKVKAIDEVPKPVYVKPQITIPDDDEEGYQEALEASWHNGEMKGIKQGFKTEALESIKEIKQLIKAM